MEKFTKGKWRNGWSLDKHRIVRSDNGIICTLWKPSHYQGQDQRYDEELKEAEANAKLISLSPLLYEELRQCVKALKVVNSMGATTPIIERVESLLKEIE